MFDLVVWDSKSEMQERLRRSGRRTLIVGTDAEAPRGFYTLEVPSDNPLVIGLLASGLGSTPGIVASASSTRLLMGHDCSLTCVDVPSGTIVATLRLDGVFFKIIQCTGENAVVIHQLGAMRVSFDGAIDWMVSSRDIVTGFHVEDENVLELSVCDAGAPLRISLVDGRQLA